MNTINKFAYSDSEYFILVRNTNGKGTFINKERRDAVAKKLKAIGYKVKKSSLKNQRLHPEYLTDFVGTYETGFGNTDYLREWSNLYVVEIK